VGSTHHSFLTTICERSWLRSSIGLGLGCGQLRGAAAGRLPPPAGIVGPATSKGGTVTEAKQKDVITRLADAGEEALQRLGDIPGTSRLLEAVDGLRDRLNDLQRKVRSLDPLERRVAELERRLDELSPAEGRAKAHRPPRPRPATSGPTSTSRGRTAATPKG
jgi:hypothetical protein